MHDRPWSNLRRLQEAGLTGQAQSAVAEQDVAAHETVVDQKGNRPGDVLRPAHPSDRGPGGVFGEHRTPLVIREEIPPRRVDQAWGDAVHPQRLEFGGEDWHERGYRGILCADPRRPRRSGVGADGCEEGDAPAFAEMRQGRLSGSEMRVDLLLEALPHL